MSDLEWYLDVNGKQSGPHTAKEIVEMVRAGKISATSQVTAARMNGDWVTAQDLISAYDELYSKPIPVPIDGIAAFSSSDPNFTAPPRPTEQLEKSKIITLNREALERAPDPTEALFQAIQGVREKANLKTANQSATSAAATRESLRQVNRLAAPKIPSQLILILVLAAIFGGTIYGFTKIISGKKAEEAATIAKPTPPKTAETQIRKSTPPPPVAGGGLLNDKGGGSSAARTTPPVSPQSRNMTGRTGGRAGDRPVGRSGGARYRDDRDPPIIDNSEEVDESDIEPPSRENSEPMPIDPSQIPRDRIIPEQGGMPVRTPLPETDPYAPPPQAGVPTD